MSSNKPLDTDFINPHIEEGTTLNIFLSNGVKLTGVILEEDEKCFLLTTDRNDDKQLVYKSMVATISPQQTRR